MAVFPWVLLRSGGRIGMTASDHDKVPGGGEDPRLASLDDRLKAAHHIEAERTAPAGANAAFTGKGASQGNRVLSTLIGAPLGAMLIGWLIDRWLGSAPKAMLAMLFFGIISAFVQIWRISRERAE
jgi:ATP synthase protein I